MRAPYPAFDGRQACAGVDPELFFPKPGIGAADRAVEVCTGCVFQAPCRAYAMDRPHLHGGWGATTNGERLRLRSERVSA